MFKEKRFVLINGKKFVLLKKDFLYIWLKKEYKFKKCVFLNMNEEKKWK
jgi:hypothetical protein